MDEDVTLKTLPPGQHVTVAEMKYLYQLMGRELEIVEEVPAGNICGKLRSETEFVNNSC